MRSTSSFRRLAGIAAVLLAVGGLSVVTIQVAAGPQEPGPVSDAEGQAAGQAILDSAQPGTSAIPSHRSRNEDTRIILGLAASPVVLDMDGKDPNVVGLGSYLVNVVGGCNDCHTHPTYAPGGSPYLGQKKKINAAQYLTGGTQFGPFTSRNLTPNPAEGSLPGGMTFWEFAKTMRTGIDHDQKHPQFGPFLQVMPWPVYQNMSDTDLRAMYEYLRAIPGLPDNPNPGP